MSTRAKVISRTGGLTIPADMRRDLGFAAGDAVDITQAAGSLIIAPHAPRCIFCDSQEDVWPYMGKNICGHCVSQLAREVGTDV